MKNNKKEELVKYIKNCAELESLKAQIQAIDEEFKVISKVNDLLGHMIDVVDNKIITDFLIKSVDEKYNRLQGKHYALELAANAIERDLLYFEYNQFLED